MIIMNWDACFQPTSDRNFPKALFSDFGAQCRKKRLVKQEVVGKMMHLFWRGIHAVSKRCMFRILQ